PCLTNSRPDCASRRPFLYRFETERPATGLRRTPFYSQIVKVNRVLMGQIRRKRRPSGLHRQSRRRIGTQAHGGDGGHYPKTMLAPIAGTKCPFFRLPAPF